jgi:foldase protein PrsA
VKIAKISGRGPRLLGIGLAVLVLAGMPPARAQQNVDQDQRFQPAPRAENATNRPQQRREMVDIRSIPIDGVKVKSLPVNPSDPIAIVNRQAITRQQLAEECVAKEGKKVLDVMINRLLIEQALARRKMSVTAAEIDEEIEAIAGRFGIPRDSWLRTLDKERGISPAQYAREIVFPAIALRKLCADQVQVTAKDLQEAFESQYGEKLRVRMILVNSEGKAIGIWEELHNNPGGFEAVAKEKSQDPGSKSLGGLLGEPITRHAYPRNLSDQAFQQLVDGDPRDKDPSHKPKDGDITGPIQAGESAWVILRRESLDPPVKNISMRDENVRKTVYDMIYQVKLKEIMESFFHELIKGADIENRLTGAVKLANEDRERDYRVDGDVQLMGNRGNGGPASGGGKTAAGAASLPKMKRPAALSPEADTQFRPLKPGGNPAPQAPAPPQSQPAAGSQ